MCVSNCTHIHFAYKHCQKKPWSLFHFGRITKIDLFAIEKRPLQSNKKDRQNFNRSTPAVPGVPFICNRNRSILRSEIRSRKKAIVCIPWFELIAVADACI